MSKLKVRRPVNILLADDGSRDALAAASLIRDLPLARGSKVTVISVIGPRGASSYPLVEARLEQTRAHLQEEGIAIETELLAGDPDKKIIEYADLHEPDLVVLGAKGLRATLGALLGSSAQEVVEYAHWPVMVVRSPYTGLKRILMVTDGSPNSQRAVDYLAQFPLPYGINIRVVHILPPLLEREQPRAKEMAVHLYATHQWERPGWKVDEEVEGQEIVNRATEALQLAGIDACGELLRGGAAEEIIAYAGENRIDLVVAGSRGLTQTSNWLVGSVSRKVTRYSGCSVLLVRGNMFA